MKSLKSAIPEKYRTKYRDLRAIILSQGLNSEAEHEMSQEENDASSLISVIIPIHDSPEVTERCLSSLERNAKKAEVILVDDGSKQKKTRQVLECAAQKNGWLLDHSYKAKGHSRACERGAGLATRPNLCFLNSDTVVTPFSWAGMIRTLEEDKNIGIVGPSTSYTSTPQSIRRADLCRFFWSDAQIDDFAFKYTNKNKAAAPLDMDYVGGFGFIVTRRAWEKSQGFDPNLPDYGNEIEFCRRLRKQGYYCKWTKKSYIHHFGESSFLQQYTSAQLLEKRIITRCYVEEKTKLL